MEAAAGRGVFRAGGFGITAGASTRGQRKPCEKMDQECPARVYVVDIGVRAGSDHGGERQPNAGNEEPALRAHGTSSPSKVSASLPNGVMLSLECSDVEALTTIIGALAHVQAKR